MDSVSVLNPLPGTGGGLGPRFNMDSCAGCHAQPDVGGSSPFTNPQIAMAHKAGGANPEDLSTLISLNGPVREVRFKVKPDGSPDGGVHDLFTIAGRLDATAITKQQTANLYSDLLVHDMRTNLADGIKQGDANGNEFRTAPLWGLGQRIFLLHDGRTSDLLQAIREHAVRGRRLTPAFRVSSCCRTATNNRFLFS